MYQRATLYIEGHRNVNNPEYVYGAWDQPAVLKQLKLTNKELKLHSELEIKSHFNTDPNISYFPF